MSQFRPYHRVFHLGLFVGAFVLMGSGSMPIAHAQDRNVTSLTEKSADAVLAGNGGSSQIDNAPAEITLGNIATGENTGSLTTSTINVSSTIERQTSTADGGDDNVARLDDRDSVESKRADGDERYQGDVFACTNNANGTSPATASSNGGAIANDVGGSISPSTDSTAELSSTANGGTGISDASLTDESICQPIIY